MKTSVAFLLLVIAGQSREGAAQSPGAFTATGNMTTARYGHTGTLLADGKVLIAGGFSLPKNEPLASAELYDPSTGLFTPTGNMTTARFYHSATLLADGRVLITGGEAAGRAGTEFYDPSTGTFTAIVGTTAAGGIATLLKNGEILITGRNTAELYDPVTDSLAPTGSYVGPFYYGPYFYQGTDTLLPDGRVLVAGNTCNGCWVEHEELYDPVTKTFKVTGKPHTVGLGSDIWAAYTATLLPNGKVLLAGGTSEDFGTFSIAELYDPSTETVTPTASMTMARAGHTATLLPGGTVLIAGGQFYSSLISAELYDPFTGTFAATANLTMARAWHTATLLPDGRVLLSGGGSGPGLASAEIYTPPVLIPAPALFSLSGDRKGQGAILHANTPRVASSIDPAVAGEYLEIYLTGLADGSVIPPQVSIGGRIAEVLWFGNTPGYLGLNQINVRVPNGVAPGPAVPVRINYIGRPSNEVTIGVR